MYIRPMIEVADSQATQMLAESLPIVTGKTVPGSAALTKPNNWDIFDEDDEDTDE
ncbi:MAG: hypothetical protein K5945_06305 [Bacteroidaceae bacterium]|nr:hypothetical protein [Bacteroidaceae bacterium]